ncbi:MAG: hypothetical protein IKB01_09490 [Lachnospiraceae bacterium]|nr:hypothetical protein [Lachnospiraceae bacterium]
MKEFLYRLRWKIQKFMQGRNGVDELNRILLYAVLVLYVSSIILQSLILDYLAFAGILYLLYRTLSKNLYVRREENRKFMTWLETTRIKMEQRKDYKIFKCKGCGRNIRVPRGKGKIEVTCPMCGKKTIHRT